MWNAHKKILFVTCGVIFLTVGVGCQKPQPLGPSPEALAIMTPGEIDAGVRQMLTDYPGTELSEEERNAETEKMRGVVQQGKVELVAPFQHRAYEAQGEVRVIKKDDRFFVAFSEDFAVDAGSFLEVYTSQNPDARTAEAVEVAEAKNLGPLKMLSGGQLYELPVDTDISKIKSIVIYCKPYKLVFGFARFF